MRLLIAPKSTTFLTINSPIHHLGDHQQHRLKAMIRRIGMTTVAVTEVLTHSSRLNQGSQHILQYVIVQLISM